MSYASEWWNLRKFKRERRAIRKHFAKKLEQLKQDKTKSPYAYAELQSEEHFEWKLMDEAENVFRSDRILEQAIECDVEVPSGDKELWQYTDDGERCYLSSKGRALMRDMIQKEQDRNFERWFRWVKALAPIVTAVAAFLGAATGCILAFKK